MKKIILIKLIICIFIFISFFTINSKAYSERTRVYQKDDSISLQKNYSWDTDYSNKPERRDYSDESSEFWDNFGFVVIIIALGFSIGIREYKKRNRPKRDYSKFYTEEYYDYIKKEKDTNK